MPRDAAGDMAAAGRKRFATVGSDENRHRATRTKRARRTAPLLNLWSPTFCHALEGGDGYSDRVVARAKRWRSRVTNGVRSFRHDWGFCAARRSQSLRRPLAYNGIEDRPARISTAILPQFADHLVDLMGRTKKGHSTANCALSLCPRYWRAFVTAGCAAGTPFRRLFCLDALGRARIKTNSRGAEPEVRMQKRREFPA